MSFHLGNAVIYTEHEAQYDAAAKRLLSDKQILAWILKYTTDEYDGMKIADIIPYIEKPDVSEVDVYPGMTNESITGMAQESAIPGEGAILYDIRFNAVVPDDRRRKNEFRIIVDIEAQKDFYPGYDLVPRGILYGGRMLSDQIGRNVNLARKEYDKLQKVYSIWICMNASIKDANTISSYQLVNKSVYGDYEDRSRSDLLRVVMIRLPNEDQIDKVKNEPNDLLKMLFKLFSEDSADEKRRSLQDDFGIQVNAGIEKEMRQMCNLSQMFKERGIAIGEAKGIAIGEARGEARGEAIGEAKGIDLGSTEGLRLLMLRDDREDEFLAAKNDSDRKEELFKEYGFWI